MVPPSIPWRGTRQIDDFGGGGFGAPRSRNGVAYTHKGLDCITIPRDPIVAPFAGGIYATPGWAYPGHTGGLRTLHLRAFPWRCTLMYVLPLPDLDEKSVSMGQPLGEAQDVAGYHMDKNGGRMTMTNHLHMELYELVAGLWTLRDPTVYLVVPKCDG